VVQESEGSRVADAATVDRNVDAVEPGSPAGGSAPPQRGVPGVRGRLVRLLTLQAFAPGAALVACVLLVGLTHPLFFSSTALEGNIQAAALVGVAAVGMVFVLAMGEVDLSVGGIYGTCFLICAELGIDGVPMYLAALVAVAAGIGLGAVNGILMRLFKAPSIIITLGTYSAYAGIANVVADGNQVGAGLPLDSSFFTFLGGTLGGVPVAGWIALVLTVVLAVILNRSRVGAMVRAAGSNPSAARFSGIPVDRLRMGGLMLTGGVAGLAGVLALAYSQGGDANVGIGYELQVLAAAIIGGTAITGGAGTVPGALIGAALVATINSGLVFFHVNPLWNNVVTGAVILLAVGSTSLLAARRAERMARVEA